MRTCLSCCREFAAAGRCHSCPHCGFNNAPKGGPRSARSLAELEQARLEQEAFERQLAELTDDMAIYMGWDASTDMFVWEDLGMKAEATP